MKETDIFNTQVNEALNSNSKVESAQYLLSRGIEFARENSLTLVATTSGGEYSAILVNLTKDINIPVLFIDMGPACYTDDTRFRMISDFNKLGIFVQTNFSKIISFDRPPTKNELDFIYGENWRNPMSLEYQSAMRELKIAPCMDALKQIIVENNSDGVLLIRGTRVDDNISGRSNIDWLGEHEYGFVLHPIADWGNEIANQYISEQNLPKNLNHLDPSRGRINEDGVINVIYPDGTVYQASHTVCLLDKASEGRF